MKPFREVTLAATLLLLAGCGDDGGGVHMINRAPGVRITAGPPEASEASYLAEVWWTGWDEDGVVDLYEYAVDPHPAFTLDEISDPEGAGLDREEAPGFEGNVVTYSKVAAGERVNFRYQQTRVTHRTFVFSTPDPDSVDVGGETLPDDRFSGLHVLYIRCRDDQGAYSPADRLAYTAVSATPTSHLERLWDERVVYTGFRFRMEWSGSDPDSPEPFGKPVGYLHKFVRLDELDPPIGGNPSVDLAAAMFQHPGILEIPWTYQPAENRSRAFDLGREYGYYAFAVRAVDVAGAVEPFLDKVRNSGPGNLTLLAVFSNSETFPTLQVTETALGDVDGEPDGVRDAAAVDFEVLKDYPLHFQWSATAEEYGGRIDAFDWGIDVEDLRAESGSGWQGWSPATSPPEPIVFPEGGSHTLAIRVRDDLGGWTLLAVRLKVLDLPRDRGVLVVDDFKDEVYPRDSEHDAFWLKMLTDSGRFDAADLQPDVWQYEAHGTDDVYYTFPIPPPISLLTRYRTIFWSNRGTGYNGNAALARSAAFTRELPAYIASGGRVWISGEATAAAMLPTRGGISNFEYPLEVTPGTFPWDWLKMYTSRIVNDKGADLRTNGLIEVDPYPGQPEIWPGLVRDDSKVRSSLQGSGTRLCDAVFDGIDTGREPDFRGVLEPLYVYGANGPRRVDRPSAYEGKLNAFRFHDPDPDPVHGPTVWFGFPMYYWYDDQAQAVVNGVIDWFREVAPTP